MCPASTLLTDILSIACNTMPVASLLGACTVTALTEVDKITIPNSKIRSDTCVGAAWASRIQDALTKHQLKNKFYGTATFAEIKAAIDKGQYPIPTTTVPLFDTATAGHLIILSTQLTSAGHLILVRGYTDSPQQLIVNDPWGDGKCRSMLSFRN